MQASNTMLVLGGVGLLLFGVSIMEEALRNIFGKSIKSRLSKGLKRPEEGFLFGLIITPILQSSSLVSLLIVAFVGAGLLTVAQSFGIIFGMNVGITLIPILLTKIGFSGLKLSKIALPLLALGGFTYGVIPHKIVKRIGYLLLGMGVLLFSIELIKNGVADIGGSINLEVYANRPVWGLIVIGLVTTAILQSSLAVFMIALSTFDAGLITITMCCAIIIGGNLGTTSTALLGSLGGGKTKRQVSLTHVFFNAILCIHAYFLLDQYLYVIFDIFGFSNQPLLGLAVFNLFINFLTACLLFIVLPWFKKLIFWLVPNIDTLHRGLLTTKLDTIDARIKSFTPKRYAIIHDCKLLMEKHLMYMIYLFNPTNNKDLSSIIKEIDDKDYHRSIKSSVLNYEKSKHIQLYEDTQQIADSILRFISLADKNLSRAYNKEEIIEYEQIIFSSMTANASIKNIHSDWLELLQEKDPIINDFLKSIRNYMILYSKYWYWELTMEVHSQSEKEKNMSEIGDITQFLPTQTIQHGEIPVGNIARMQNIIYYIQDEQLALNKAYKYYIKWLHIV